MLFFSGIGTDINRGLKADERAITAQGVPVTTVSAGSAIRNGEEPVEITATALEDLINETDDALRKIDCKVVKIGS